MDNIFLLSKFDKAESTIKPWAVAQLFTAGEFVYHKNCGSFFERRCALKRFCDFSNQSYEEYTGEQYEEGSETSEAGNAKCEERSEHQ